MSPRCLSPDKSVGSVAEAAQSLDKGYPVLQVIEAGKLSVARVPERGATRCLPSVPHVTCCDTDPRYSSLAAG